MVESVQNQAQAISDAYAKLIEATAEDDHAKVDQLTSQILAIDDSEKTLKARHARLVSLIKQREFTQALTFLNKHDSTKKGCVVEAAYILHRQDQNKQALAMLQKVDAAQRNSRFYEFTAAQVNYKLGNFEAAADLFSSPNSELYGDIGDQVDDICTNIAACAANESSICDKSEKIFAEFAGQLESFEFKFNQSLISLKQQDFSAAIMSLLQAFEKAQAEGCSVKEQTRFKVQELHMINCFQAVFNNIEHSTNPSFILPRNMVQNNLIESNMTAMQNLYDLNKSQFKELIGNLNWKRFSERIQTQLASNSLLTIEQKQLMEVNSIVSLVLSHQFDAARALWRKIRNDNKHSALKGVGVFFYLKDKKFEEALGLLEKEQDMYSVFLRSQILLADKKPREALLNLGANFERSLVTCAGYTNLLLKTAISFELPLAQMQKIVDAIKGASSSASVDCSVFINLSKYLEQQGEKAQAVEVLKNTLKHSKDPVLQARYLTLLTDVDFAAAEVMQQSLAQPDFEDEKMNDTEAIQKLIEEAMPEHKKVKKTKDVDVQSMAGGACVYIPMKRKRRPKLPKSFDPENPGPVPDPERWLPKWQQSKYKKFAKKRGIYLKGAQGDAQIDTDVSKLANQATASVATSNNNNRNKRRRK